MIKAILFDLDGTLLDTNELILASFKEAFSKCLNLNLEDSEVVKHFGKPLQYSFSTYGNKEKVQEMINTYREYNDRNHDTKCMPFEGVHDVLQQLKNKGIKIAIVTSKRKIMSERGMKISGIYDYFDVIITPECTEKHKPDKEPALKACELLDISPSNSIFVGDSTFDILCGKNAGCYTCAVKYTALPLDELEKVQPDFYISKFDELLSVINKINNNEKDVLLSI